MGAFLLNTSRGIVPVFSGLCCASICDEVCDGDAWLASCCVIKSVEGFVPSTMVMTPATSLSLDIINANHTDFIFVSFLFFFVEWQCPWFLFEMGPLWVFQTLSECLPSLYWLFISGCPGATVFKVAGSSSGLQLPVLFKTLGSVMLVWHLWCPLGPCSYSTSHGGWLGPCLCLVASPCRATWSYAWLLPWVCLVPRHCPSQL